MRLALIVILIFILTACSPKSTTPASTKSVAEGESVSTANPEILPPKDPTVGLDQGDPEKGKDYFNGENRGRCLACHTLAGKGEMGSYPLDDTGLRRSPKWLAQFLFSPRQLRSEVATMPPYRGDPVATIADVVAFLMTLKTPVEHPANTDVKPPDEPDKHGGGIPGRSGQNIAFDD
jgi:mono/diheme cytochrome c family protein